LYDGSPVAARGVRRLGDLDMPLPETVEVKLSSEEAGTISITRVLKQEMSGGELLDRIVAVTGKDAQRIRRILHAGTLLDSATRYRWQAAELTIEEVESHLQVYPDPEPTLPFEPSRCVEALLLDSSGLALRVSRDDGSRRRVFRRDSFWTRLMSLVAPKTLDYVSYSYRDGADRYRLELSPSLRDQIRQTSGLLRSRYLYRSLLQGNWIAVEFLVRRPVAEHPEREPQ